MQGIKIEDYLYERFSSVYCDSCRFDTTSQDNCGECCKTISLPGWALSKEVSKDIADNILKLIRGENNGHK